MATVTWTGRSCTQAGLLYLKYANVADVHDDAGKRIGEVFQLLDGKYFPKHWKDIAGERVDTVDEAIVKVEDMERRFG